MKTSRLEINKQVRVVLCRHGVDLTQLQFSFVGSSVRLDGLFLKSGGADFSAVQIEAIVSDLCKIPEVQSIHSNLLNWSISGGAISKLSHQRSTNSEDQYDQYQDDEDEEAA